MILRVVHRSILKIYTPKSSAFLFCNKKPKGFGKFDRKIQKDDKSEKQMNNQNQPKDKKEQSMNKSDNLGENISSKGFNKFSRKVNPKTNEENHQKKEQGEFVNKQQQKDQINDNIQQSSDRSPNETKQNREQNFNQQKQMKGFIKFTKKFPNKKTTSKTQTNSKEINQQNINKFEQKTNSSQDQQGQEINKNELPKQQKDAENQSSNFVKSTKQQEIKGFNKFQKQEETKQQQKKHQFEQQKLEKSPEELEREELQKKQTFFKQKVDEFKRLKKKGEQQEKNIPYLQIQRLTEQFYSKIEKLIGIDLRKQAQPPLFVKKIPFLLNSYILFMQLRLFIVALLLIYLYFYSKGEQKLKQIDPDQVLEFIQKGEVLSITFQSHKADISRDFGKKQYKQGIIVLKDSKNKVQFKCNDEFENILKGKIQSIQMIGGQSIPIYYQKKNQPHLEETIRTLLSAYLLFSVISSVTSGMKGVKGKAGRQGGAGFNMFGESKSKRFQHKVDVKFEHVVGMQKAKEQIVQFIDFLSHPQKYKRLGAKIPRGALLTGPPGTGKTMIAKACAGQSDVPFFTISGSQFMEMYVGVGAQRVRELFKEAKQSSPSIIFIDEIDAVGKKRATGFGGGNDERDNTLNQLLVEMDGFNTDSNVIVFAATNQRDVLDPALTRPGRFDRLIEVDLPDIEGRKQIFRVHLKPIVIDQNYEVDEYARRMATLTPGFSGADIRNLCNEAAIIAARQDKKFVSIHDFQMATERIIGGVQKKSSLITPETKKIVSYHECGHGVCSWFMQGANPLLKLTIIPRSKGALGFAQYLPYESQISTRKQLEDQICVILGGRVSEQIFFKKISTGAYDDLQKAYQVAKMIVTHHGMNDRVGWLRLQESQYTKYYSKETQKIIDEQILMIIKNCTVRTMQLLSQKRQLIEKLAEKLLQKQTIDQSIISEVLGDRPFKANKQYEEYLKEKKKIKEQLLTMSSNKAVDHIV